MNHLIKKICFRAAGRLSALALGIFLAVGAHAQTPQPGRFLLVFETSPAVKKKLPAIEQALDRLFADGFQGELQDNDDLAVWTVDQDLHTGAFPLASWSAGDAELFASRLKEFLGRQNFTRHASLAAVQPLLNRVVKNSERLTILIFCDPQSKLLGTPYDSGVNEAITNATAKAAQPLILVVRAHQGEYLGASVNRSLPLNFPAFPPPPKPEPPPKPAPAPVAETTPAMPPRMFVKPVSALIIVGTNASTNLASAPKPLLSPSPQPENVAVTNAATNPPPTAVSSITITHAPTVEPKTTAPGPSNPPPPANLPAATSSVAVTAPMTQNNQQTEPSSAMPSVAAPTNPPPAPVSNVFSAMSEDNASDKESNLPVIVGGAAIAASASVVGWLLVRARRPRGSLITSSMQNDTLLPPRK